MADFVASFETTAEIAGADLFYSDTPAPVTRPFPVGPSTTMKRGTPVKQASPGGPIVPVAPGDKAIGVLAVDVSTDTTTTTTAPVYQSGHFRLDALVFDPAFTTDTEKFAVFDGTTPPVQIFVSKAYNDGSGIKL